MDTENVSIKGWVQDDKSLWLVTDSIPNWKLSTYKDWLYWVYKIREAAAEKGVEYLYCYAKTKQITKFATMLGFEPYKDIIMRQACAIQ